MSDFTLLAAEKKRALEKFRRQMRAGGLDNLERSHRIDITYSSNAIEGNTLTAGETALVLEKGITVAGKPLKDHLEAIDHAHALDWVYGLASEPHGPISEADIRSMHQLIVAQSHPQIAGRYADVGRFVNTSEGPHRFPSPLEVPALMSSFVSWLSTAEDGPQAAWDAHRKLVAIHPFNDGNGRTARLLMNLILLRAGYPAISIRPTDRATYIGALEAIEAGEGSERFDNLLSRRLCDTLDQYITAAIDAAFDGLANKFGRS